MSFMVFLRRAMGTHFAMIRNLVVFVHVGVGLVACSKSNASTSESATAATATSASPKVTADGPTLYRERCAACHGASGKGDGAAAANLVPKPRDHSDKAWQTSVTDEQIGEIILKGGAGVGKSPMMPANPDLEGSPEAVARLVATVRAFGGK